MYRAKYNLSQNDLAEKLNISLPSYRNKENGKSKFSLDEAKKISDIFQKSIMEIFFETEVYNKETIINKN